MATSLNTRWRAGEVTLGLWVSTPGADTAETIAAFDVAYVCVDLQHGLIDLGQGRDVLRALRTSTATPICRVAGNDAASIGAVLDAGALGVIVPMVNSADEARAAVAACRYAPDGRRSFGPTRAALVHGTDLFGRANHEISCIPMIETVEAIEHLDEILDVEGIDAVYVGPSDLGVSMGLGPGVDHDDARFRQALAAVLAGCARRGIVPGIHASPGLVPARVQQGFRMVTVTTDLQALRAGLIAALATADPPASAS
jgi:4-hydroxy-2-oxoheptanedioate aldolase